MIALDALFKGRLCCFPKDPLGDVETWSESVDKVLSCKGETGKFAFEMPEEPLTLLLLVPSTSSAGQIAFREFLRSEYSEENIMFWLACEEYKKIKTVPEMISSANRIFSEYVQTEAPKQVWNEQRSQLQPALSKCVKGSPWKTSQLISDQHRLRHQRKHHQKHLPADLDVIWYGAEAHLQPDGQGLLPAIPKIRNLPGTPEERRVQVTVLKACDAALAPQLCSSLLRHLTFAPDSWAPWAFSGNSFLIP